MNAYTFGCAAVLLSLAAGAQVIATPLRPAEVRVSLPACTEDARSHCWVIFQILDVNFGPHTEAIRVKARVDAEGPDAAWRPLGLFTHLGYDELESFGTELRREGPARQAGSVTIQVEPVSLYQALPTEEETRFDRIAFQVSEPETSDSRTKGASPVCLVP